MDVEKLNAHYVLIAYKNPLHFNLLFTFISDILLTFGRRYNCDVKYEHRHNVFFNVFKFILPQSNRDLSQPSVSATVSVSASQDSCDVIKFAGRHS